MVKSLVSFDIARFTQSRLPSTVINIALRNVPFSRKVFEKTIGIPFSIGDEIIPAETKEYTDIPSLYGNYSVPAGEKLTVTGFSPSNTTTHYLLKGEFYNLESRRFCKTSLYIPIEAIHGRFKLISKP